MLKNRTLLGLLSIILAIILVFCISPLFNKVFEGKMNVILLKSPVLQGQQITPDMLISVEMGSYNLPGKVITEKNAVIGKYATSNLYSGSLIFPEMLSETTDTSDTILRNLKENETAMSVTIKSFANGVSGKLMTGDIIKIVSVDNEKIATIYEELSFVEVLTTTTENGADNINQQVIDENGEISQPVTITVILQDELQALKLAECENTSLHAIFVSRDENKKDEYIKKQAEILKVLKGEETAETETIPENTVLEESVANEMSGDEFKIPDWSDLFG